MVATLAVEFALLLLGAYAITWGMFWLAALAFFGVFAVVCVFAAVITREPSRPGS